jgi:MinD superfamily P-loop ATPase
MPEILVISGKGGTGKTSLTAALAQLAENHILCDLDVDAPDLHLLLKPSNSATHEFWSGHEAVINTEACTQCGQCRQICRFDAVIERQDEFFIDTLRCEGCKVCVALCPEQAIDFNPKQCGKWHVSRTRQGTTMVHAQLFPGEENSGRLVALLRQEAKTIAENHGEDLIISDGPPGIGCPVISALSGVDLAVIVTEPTPSGRHDLERIVGLCNHFKTQMSLVINKWDLNPTLSREIQNWCLEQAIPVAALLPYDPDFVHALVAGKTIMEFSNGPLQETIRSAWRQIRAQVYPFEQEILPATAGSLHEL